ncbi:DNA polymerase I, partial [Achromatium sp. WMS1]
AFGLSKQLNISRQQAQQYINLYFQRYPQVQAFMERIKTQAQKHGFVETLFGRRLALPEINSKSHQRRVSAERTAINAPMQGTAADIIKRAMLQIDNWLSNERIPARMIMQVHDELVLEIHNDHVDQIRSQITKLMTTAATLRVPLVVNSGIGTNWEQAH